MAKKANKQWQKQVMKRAKKKETEKGKKRKGKEKNSARSHEAEIPGRLKD